MKTFYKISPLQQPYAYGSGFFSNYRICLEKMMLMQTKNTSKAIPYIDWSHTLWIDGWNPIETMTPPVDYNPFDFWFEQEIPTIGDNIIDGQWEIPFIIDHTKDYFNNKTELDAQKLFDEKYFIVKKEIVDKIDAIYESELKDEIVLGVMARGCEYNHYHPNYGIFEIDDYIREIKKILKKYPEITKLFLVSEDGSYIEKLSKEFPNSYFVPDVFRRTDETMKHMNNIFFWPNISSKRDNQNKLLGEEVIIQTKLLGKCDYLFGRHTGVLAGAILWSKNIKQLFKI